MEPYLASTMVTLKSQSEQITEAIKRLKILSELEDLDAVRERAISPLGHVLNGYANMPTAEAHQHTPPLKKCLIIIRSLLLVKIIKANHLWSNYCLLI